MKPKILVATPCFNGTVYLNYFISFLSTLTQSGDEYEINLFTNHRDGLVSVARNAAAAHALNNGYDKLFFIDADISWTVEDFKKIALSNKDIVGGLYPYKSFPIELVCNTLPDAQSDGHEVEVFNIATGFLCINTKVLKALCGHVGEYVRQGKPGQPRSLERDFFRVGLIKNYANETVYGTEDFGFCDLARTHGFKLWANSSVIVTHTGLHEYRFTGEK